MGAWLRGDIACHHELAREYTRRYPLNVAGWLSLAEVFIRFARYDDAASALYRAKRLARSSKRYRALVLTTLGELFMERGRKARALRYYREAAVLRPTTNTLVLLGCALARTGALEEAKRCHRRAARLATHNPDEAYYNLGLILRAERRYEAARSYFDLALEHDPEYELARDARSDCAQALSERSGSRRRTSGNERSRQRPSNGSHA